MDDKSINIEIHATSKLDAIITHLEKIFPQVCKPLGFNVTVEFLPIQHGDPLFQAMGTSRARTYFPDKIYINAQRVCNESALIPILCEEFCHILQHVRKSPLFFPSWKFLNESDIKDKLRQLFYTLGFTLKFKPKKQEVEKVINRPDIVARCANPFADADAHTYLVRKGIVSKSTYLEYLVEYARDFEEQSEKLSLIHI